MLISSSQVLTSRFLSRSSFPHHFRLLNHYLTTSGRAHAVHVCTRNMSSVLEDLKFDNRALKSLPIDRETENYVRSVAGACFSRVRPTPLTHPKLVAHSQPALDLLGLAPDQVHRPEFVEYLSGNEILPGSEPASHCYCGHQFGHFAGQLGDGCAHYLGEVVGAGGERWELQLKGSGKTPFSRSADGRKVLRSSIREFLCSEAMHFLGIPTTRAGSCITSDDTVTRDVHYDGHPIQERCTVITRIAPSFIRFGSFEIFKTRDPETGRVGPSVGQVDILHQLLDFVIQSYYPQAHSSHAEDRPARTAAFFRELCLRTAHLVAAWQSVGFCHGVLNTDNMSIVGVTIDYGPYGFMDKYDPGHICNGSDNGGRYAYNRQPQVCRWNLGKLAEALSSCLSEEATQEGLRVYDAEFEKSYLTRMRQKLGLKKQLEDDSDLVESLLDAMHVTGCDFTNGFYCLSHVRIPDKTEHVESLVEKAVEYFLDECASPQQLVQSFKPRIPPHQLHMFLQLMQQAPVVLEALGMTADSLQQEIIKMEQADKLKNMSISEKRSQDRAVWVKWLTRYGHRLHQEMEPETSADVANKERWCIMQQSNPRFILRNHILQTAIEHAENGDFSEVQQLFRLLQTPYTPPPSCLPTRPAEETIDSVPQLHKTVVDHDKEKGEGDMPGGDTERTENVTEDASVVTTAVAAEVDGGVSRYYSKPPDWALTLCVT